MAERARLARTRLGLRGGAAPQKQRGYAKASPRLESDLAVAPALVANQMGRKAGVRLLHSPRDTL
jgi:hypothetical protein